VTYNWSKGAWTKLPLGNKTPNLYRFDKLPVQFGGTHEYNCADAEVAPARFVDFVVKLLLPI